MEIWNITKALNFKRFLHLSYKNTITFCMTVLFNIFMRQTTYYFWGLHKNMNCAFPLRTSFYRIPPDDSFYSIVCIYHPPRSKTPPPFFLPSPLLKSANCSSTPFLGNPPLYVGFSWTPFPLPKSHIFQWTAKMFKFFILNTILSFKSN